MQRGEGGGSALSQYSPRYQLTLPSRASIFPVCYLVAQPTTLNKGTNYWWLNRHVSSFSRALFRRRNLHGPSFDPPLLCVGAPLGIRTAAGHPRGPRSTRARGKNPARDVAHRDLCEGCRLATHRWRRGPLGRGQGVSSGHPQAQARGTTRNGQRRTCRVRTPAGAYSA